MTELRAGPLAATWLPEHGMVGASLRHEGEELLGQRGGLDAYLARGSAFGIPLLAPWANRLDGLRYDEVEIDPARVKLDGAGLPKDGVMAGRAWTVTEETADRLTATFESDPPVLAVFPFPHRLTVEVALAPEVLTVRTSLTATGVIPVPVSFGWHPLFTLPGVAREALEVEVPAVEESVLDDRGIPTGARRPPRFGSGALGDRTADDEYPVIDGDLRLRGGGRELTVRFGAPDYPVGHLWAPAGESFVAWEPMTAPTNALVSGDGLRRVVPGRTFTATFSVHVEGR
jgi:galactose mutarotase-like enzyme